MLKVDQNMYATLSINYRMGSQFEFSFPYIRDSFKLLVWFVLKNIREGKYGHIQFWQRRMSLWYTLPHEA